MSNATQSRNQVLDSALQLAELGFCVLPAHSPAPDGGCSCGNQSCDKIGKHPRIQDWVNYAANDADHIREWFTEWPDANLGVLAGQRSGIVVVDIDPRNGGDESLAELEEKEGALPETVECLTGGGGRHLYFKHPTGEFRVNNDIAPGVEIKATGRQVIAPPSTHPSGQKYRWEKDREPWSVELAHLPDWLRSMAAKKEKPTSTALTVVSRLPAKKEGADEGISDINSLPRSASHLVKVAVERAINGEGRNDKGFWLACQLRDVGLSYGEAYRAMQVFTSAAPKKGHHYAMEEAEASLKQAYSAVNFNDL